MVNISRILVCRGDLIRQQILFAAYRGQYHAGDRIARSMDRGANIDDASDFERYLMDSFGFTSDSVGSTIFAPFLRFLFFYVSFSPFLFIQLFIYSFLFHSYKLKIYMNNFKRCRTIFKTT